jgi:hypothetical protein
LRKEPKLHWIPDQVRNDKRETSAHVYALKTPKDFCKMGPVSPSNDEGLISCFDYLKGWFKLSWRLPAILRTQKDVLNVGIENRESWGSMLEENALKFPDNPAIKSAEANLSWREYNEAVNRCANFFISKGLKKGDVACIFLENRPENPNINC